MSMYAMLFGKNPYSSILLKSLGLDEGDFYRFRDCYVDEDGHIAVYTRGGGNNRDCYCDHLPDDQHEEGCAVIVQSKVKTHPLYLYDRDDDFDNTYATFYFTMPKEEWLKDIKPQISREELWKIFLDALKRK